MRSHGGVRRGTDREARPQSSRSAAGVSLTEASLTRGGCVECRLGESRSRAATAAQRNSEHSQRTERRGAPMTERRRGERAFGFSLRTVVFIRDRRDGVRGDIDVERKFARQLIRAGLQVARADELAIAEKRAALILAGGVAGVHRFGLAAFVVVRLTAEHAVAIHFFFALVLDDAQALGFTIGRLITRAAALALSVAVVRAAVVTPPVIAAEMMVGLGARSTVIGTFTDAYIVGALGADGFALLRTRLLARLLAARDIRNSTALPAHLIRLLRADLLDRGGRAGRLALLDRLEFTVGISAQVHTTTLIERFGLHQLRHDHGQRRESDCRQRGRDSNTHDKNSLEWINRDQFAD